MSVRAKCTCGAAFNAKPELIGKSVKCPSCGGVLTVPKPLSSRPAILVKCPCGSSSKAKAELAGKQVSCLSCGRLLEVPNPYATAARIRVACACGRAFKVKSDLGGKRVKCPGCGHVVAIPDPTPKTLPTHGTLAAGAPTDDPFGLDAADDPLDLNSLGSDELSSSITPRTEQRGAVPSGSTAVSRLDLRRAPRTSHNRRFSDPNSGHTTAFGVLMIMQGALGLPGVFFLLLCAGVGFTAATAVGTPLIVKLFTAVLWMRGLLGLAIAVGFLVSGILFLKRDERGVYLGVLTALVHLGSVALGFGASIVIDLLVLLNSEGTPSIGDYVFSGGGYIIASIVPFLVIKYVYENDLEPVPCKWLIDRTFGSMY